MGKKYSVFLCVLFCGVLLAFFAAQLIVPDKEFSPNENRYLQQKPELTAESFQLRFPLEESGDFFTGKFMSTFETYVTDQFPGRDGWISTKSLSEKIMGKRENNGVYFGTDNQTLISRFDEPDPDRVVRNLDYVNKLVEKAKSADGFVFGTPVYYSHPSGRLLSVLDRAFYSGGAAFAYKPAAAVASARRAGTIASIDVINKHFTINKMPVISSTYWNEVHGNTPEDVLQDKEGLQTMRNLGKNMAWALKLIDEGKKLDIAAPVPESGARTDFIR